MGAATTAAADAGSAGRVWVWNPAVDLLIGCAGWSLPFLALSAEWAQSGALDVAYGFALLTLVCNHPHYMATLQRAWSDPDRRAAYRPYLVHLVALLAVAAAAMVLYPPLVPAFVTAYVIWSPWHYSGQNFGLVMLFARRADAQPERRLLRSAFLASYVVWLLTVQSRPTSDPYIWSLDLPAAVVDPAALVMTLAFLILASIALGRMGERSGWRSILPPLVLLSSQTLWFIAPWLLQVAGGRGLSPLYYSTGALAFMHCAQYLWLTSWVAKRESGPDWRPARYAALLVIGGIALFTAGPWLSSVVGGADLRESTLIVVALVNLHHFILDGALWRLRDARAAAILFGAPPSAPATAARRPRLRPALAWSLAVLLFGLAGLNALQQYLTRADADAGRLALAERLNPHDTRIAVRRAELLAESQQPRQALQTLAPLLELRPANAAALRLYGALLVADGRYDDALIHLRAVDRFVGLDAPGLVNVGVLLARSGRTPDAAAALQRAIHLDPALPAAHLNLAGLCLQEGDVGCALAHYDVFLGSPDAPRDRDYATALINAAGAAQVAQRPGLAAALRKEGAALATALGAADLVEAADRQLAASTDAP